MRLIDADAAKKELTGWDTDPTDEEIEYTIDHIPTIDAVPVVHGRWVFVEVPSLSWYGHNPGWYCSNCGWKIEDKRRKPRPPAMKHCPNCTARMYGEKE